MSVLIAPPQGGKPVFGFRVRIGAKRSISGFEIVFSVQGGSRLDG